MRWVPQAMFRFTTGEKADLNCGYRGSRTFPADGNSGRVRSD